MKKKGSVIDLFSRKRIDTTNQDTKDNDTKASEGIYLGHVQREIAEIVRDSETLLEAKASQIDDMVDQWERMAMGHFTLIDHVLQILDVGGFDPQTHTLSISEDGHVWVVPKEERRETNER